MYLYDALSSSIVDNTYVHRASVICRRKVLGDGYLACAKQLKIVGVFQGIRVDGG